MRKLKKLVMGSIALSAVSLLTLTTAAATAGDSSTPRDKLALWAGHWKRYGEVKETQFAHARKFDYDVKCSLLPFGDYLVCNSLSLEPDPNDGGRISNQVTLIYYSDVDKTFKITKLNMEGGPHEELLSIDGSTWTEPVQISRKSGGTADARFLYTFVSSDKKVARFEISLDKGASWIIVDEFVDTKES